MNEISGNQGGIVTETAHRLGDDPERRRPDITRANEILGWEPKISFRDGLVKTIPYFKQKLDL
jgi:nucleoside-diphosphate-sugar epimerase